MEASYESYIARLGVAAASSNVTDLLLTAADLEEVIADLCQTVAAGRGSRLPRNTLDHLVKDSRIHASMLRDEAKARQGQSRQPLAGAKHPSVEISAALPQARPLTEVVATLAELLSQVSVNNLDQSGEEIEGTMLDLYNSIYHLTDDPLTQEVLARLIRDERMHLKQFKYKSVSRRK